MARLTSRDDYQRPKPDMAPPPAGIWYAIICNPNCEHKARDNLAAICRPYLPTAANVVKGGGHKREERVSERALFPRYVFVSNLRAGMFPFFLLRGVQGVESIVRADGYPLPIPHAVVAEIMEREDRGDFDKTERFIKPRSLAEAGWQAGDEARVKGGAFEGWVARVESLAGNGQDVRVLVDMLGGVVRAKIALADLKRVA